MRTAMSGMCTALAVQILFGGVTMHTEHSLPKSARTEAFSWSDGAIAYSNIINCVSIIYGTPYVERGIGTYVGFYADAAALRPAPYTVYYVHVVVAGLGNACSGQRAYIDLQLPVNTVPAVSATDKIYYYYNNTRLSDAESPQFLTQSAYNPGAWHLASVDAQNAYTWPIPQGWTLEIQVPVMSTTPLTGAPLTAHVWALDGNSSPWLRPQVGVHVFFNQPVITYPNPSTISITATTARSLATLYPYGAAGVGYFELGTTPSYGLVRDSIIIAAGYSVVEVWDDWDPPTLQPSTQYHWRFSFKTGGQIYYGTNQTFTTAPAPLAARKRQISEEARRNEGGIRVYDMRGRLTRERSSAVAVEVSGHAGPRFRSPTAPQDAR